mgnify:CR=1 FL=1
MLSFEPKKPLEEVTKENNLLYPLMGLSMPRWLGQKYNTWHYITGFLYITIMFDILWSKEHYLNLEINILNNLEDIKKISINQSKALNLLKKFYEYKNEVLKYTTTDFVITTSWFTKIEPMQMTQIHSHTNSLYSGVLYIDEYDDKSSSIVFHTNIQKQILLNPPDEWNILNCDSWNIKPKNNMLLFFPSYLLHSITTNNSNNTRYSLAFNIHPIGLYGGDDSSIKINVLD